MHVNNNQFQPQVDLNSPKSEFKLKTSSGNLQGRSTTVITSNSSNSAVAKLDSKAQTQFQNITLQSSENTAPLQASSLSRKKAAGDLTRTEKFALMQDFAAEFNKDPSKAMYQVEARDGKIIAKSINHEDIKNNPLPPNATIVTAQEVDGQLFVHSHEGRPLTIDEVHDEHGQVRDFQILSLDDELYSQLQDIVGEHIDNYIATKFAQHQETNKTEKDTKTDDKPTTHTPPQSPRYEYNPKTIEQKNDEEFGNNDVSKLLSENPKVILRNVLEAESLLEAKKMNQERAQEAKKKLIDEQEERREIRHEGYKQDDIKQGKQRHEILNETLHHQETERPASISTVQQGKNDEG